jgi:hypothetical protein
MTKNFWLFGTLATGILLCIFGNSAFAAIGVIVGLGAVAFGIYIFFTSAQQSVPLLILAISLAVVGIVLVVLCIFVEEVAFFLGGLIMIATGVLLLPSAPFCQKLILPFCIGCIAMGIIILFASAFIGWLSIVVGIMLILFSGLVLAFM